MFNRLVGKKLALVDDRPGVTRDRREGEASLLGLEFRVIDTAGYEDEDPQTLPGRMRAQTTEAVREADAALFLIDARAGLPHRTKKSRAGCGPRRRPSSLPPTRPRANRGRPAYWKPSRWAWARRSR